MRWLAVLVLGLWAACGRVAAVPDGWVDRIEGEYAVILVTEGGEYREAIVPLALLPPEVGEGDALVAGRVDEEARRRLARRIRALQEGLLRRSAD